MKSEKNISDAVCPGFKFAGIVSGLKKNNQKDLGLIVSEVPASAAGLFTKNLVKAAPVLLDKERIKSGKCRAIIVNSGNANCCTGEQGMKDARSMSKLAASALNISEELVLVASTGVIGKPLDINKIKNAMPDLTKCLSENGIENLARAIMTTDTVPKIISKQLEFNGKKITILGAAKGAGMIRPDMATMLCFVCTDAEASPDALHKMLVESVDCSFNTITIDGDTSTNDTVLLLANGLSGLSLNEPAAKDFFQKALNEALLELARAIVRDGEGVTKLVTVCVKNAAGQRDAKKVADTVSHSNLVKTALFGEDANWGRILAAAGRSGVEINPDKIDIFFNEVQMVKNGVGCGDDAEKEATKILKKPEFSIIIDLKMGNENFSMYTCDFSLDYVRINADYRT